MTTAHVGGAAALRVLLVEDNPFHHRLVAAMTVEAFDGNALVDHVGCLEDALDRLAGEQHDCVLLDLMLPDAIGLEGLHRILAVYPNVPVVIVSAHDDVDTAVRCVEEGAQDYLVKGIADEHQLKLAILHAIERTGRVAGPAASLFSFQHSPVAGTALGLAVLDPGGRFASVEKIVCTILGRSAEDLIGRPVPVHPEYSGEFAAAIQAVQAVDAFDAGPVLLRVRFVDPGNEPVPADVHLGAAFDVAAEGSIMMQVSPAATAAPSTSASTPAEIGWRAAS